MPLALLVAAAAAVYVRVYRPWQLTWGATREEVAADMPGDDLVPRPTFNATRAIAIDAPPHEVWPWLVQVGVGRGGWYSYDLLDNLGRPSARRIIPDLQNLAEGDLLPMSPDGTQGIRVHTLALPDHMIWGTPGDTTWTWILKPQVDGSTRVVTRIRSQILPTPASVIFAMLLELADVWMLRKMLLTVRQRVHGAHRP